MTFFSSFDLIFTTVHNACNNKRFGAYAHALVVHRLIIGQIVAVVHSGRSHKWERPGVSRYATYYL